MLKLVTADGRTLTPPKEVKPLLKGAFPAFFKLLGYIRFFYVADEIWDVEASLVFKQLATLTLEDGAFYVRIEGERFHVIDETRLEAVYAALRKAAAPAQRRPAE